MAKRYAPAQQDISAQHNRLMYTLVKLLWLGLPPSSKTKSPDKTAILKAYERIQHCVLLEDPVLSKVGIPLPKINIKTVRDFIRRQEKLINLQSTRMPSATVLKTTSISSKILPPAPCQPSVLPPPDYEPIVYEHIPSKAGTKVLKGRSDIATPAPNTPSQVSVPKSPLKSHIPQQKPSVLPTILSHLPAGTKVLKPAPNTPSQVPVPKSPLKSHIPQQKPSVLPTILSPLPAGTKVLKPAPNTPSQVSVPKSPLTSHITQQKPSVLPTILSPLPAGTKVLKPAPNTPSQVSVPKSPLTSHITQQKPSVLSTIFNTLPELLTTTTAQSFPPPPPPLFSTATTTTTTTTTMIPDTSATATPAEASSSHGDTSQRADTPVWSRATIYKRKYTENLTTVGAKVSRVHNLPICKLCKQTTQGHKKYKKKTFCYVKMMSTSAGLDTVVYSSYKHFTTVVDALQ